MNDAALLEAPRAVWRHQLRVLARAIWLGWKVESSWADPFVFAAYSIVKPLAASLTVIVMYAVVAGGKTSGPLFAFAFLGSAFSGFFQSLVAGLTMVAVDDREFTETLHYVYISPASLLVYLLGRAMARFAVSSGSVAVVITLGTLLTGLPIRISQIDWPLLVVSLALGFVCLCALGVLVCGASLLLTHRVWYLMDGVGGLFFFFSGTIFPVTQLPPPLRAISYALPTTYWMDLVRRALCPACVSLSPFGAGTEGQLLCLLALMSVVVVSLARAGFTRCLATARRWGYIHRKTHF